MPWHALTFDGLDGMLADVEFADQVPSAPDTAAGTITQVNAPLVDSFMQKVSPHLQKAVSAGISDAAGFLSQHKTAVSVAAGGAAVLALLFLWRISSQLKTCCPAPQRPMSGCGYRPPTGECC